MAFKSVNSAVKFVCLQGKYSVHVVDSSNPRGRSHLRRNKGRGLRCGCRTIGKSEEKEKSTPGGRGNKSVRPATRPCDFLFALVQFFPAVSCHIDRKTNETPRSTCPSMHCDETSSVYVFHFAFTKNTRCEN